MLVEKKQFEESSVVREEEKKGETTQQESTELENPTAPTDPDTGQQTKEPDRLEDKPPVLDTEQTTNGVLLSGPAYVSRGAGQSAL